MGGGRKTKDDIIDPYAGLIFYKKIGDMVNSGDVLVEIHARNHELADYAKDQLDNIIGIGDNKPSIPKLIKNRIS